MSKPLAYWLALLLDAACLTLVVLGVVLDQKNRAVQDRLRRQIAEVQEELQGVAGVEGVSRDILSDLGDAAVSNVEIRVLLARYGYSLSNATNGPRLTSAEVERHLDLVELSRKADSRKPGQEQKP